MKSIIATTIGIIGRITPMSKEFTPLARLDILYQDDPVIFTGNKLVHDAKRGSIELFTDAKTLRETAGIFTSAADYLDSIGQCQLPDAYTVTEVVGMKSEPEVKA